MEKERGMEEHCVPPARQEFPQLKQLPCVSLQNHHVIGLCRKFCSRGHEGAVVPV